jgi:excisionase family DNA binding protein
MSNIEPALTIEQVALRLNVSRFAVWSLIVRRQLRAFTISNAKTRKHYRILAEWLDEYIQSATLSDAMKFEPVAKQSGLSSKKKICKKLPKVVIN